jgi:hypothetical protein
MTVYEGRRNPETGQCEIVFTPGSIHTEYTGWINMCHELQPYLEYSFPCSEVQIDPDTCEAWDPGGIYIGCDWTPIRVLYWGEDCDYAEPVVAWSRDDGEQLAPQENIQEDDLQ